MQKLSNAHYHRPICAGKFHRGDSYIILKTSVPPANPDKLEWDIHFWIGSQSSQVTLEAWSLHKRSPTGSCALPPPLAPACAWQDEYGTAAYKTVELDDYLRDGATQHREVEGSESVPFLACFGGRLTYLVRPGDEPSPGRVPEPWPRSQAGGVATGFRHVETREREPKLLEVKGVKASLRLRQVALSRSSMNTGDVYILDADSAIYVWNGAASNAHERAKAADVANGMASDRGGGTRVVVVADAEPDESDPFWKLLPGERRFLGFKCGLQTLSPPRRTPALPLPRLALSPPRSQVRGHIGARHECRWRRFQDQGVRAPAAAAQGEGASRAQGTPAAPLPDGGARVAWRCSPRRPPPPVRSAPMGRFATRAPSAARSLPCRGSRARMCCCSTRASRPSCGSGAARTSRSASPPSPLRKSTSRTTAVQASSQSRASFKVRAVLGGVAVAVGCGAHAPRAGTRAGKEAGRFLELFGPAEKGCLAGTDCTIS